MEVKKGVSFGESSPVLNNISGAASWEKVTAVILCILRAWSKCTKLRF
jgi:hypothetical protein